jgi:hypothetical protein
MTQPQNPQPRPGLSPGTPEARPLGEAPGPQPQRVAVRLPLHRPIVTWVLLAVIVAVFLVETLLGGSTDTGVLIRMGAKSTPLIAAGIQRVCPVRHRHRTGAPVGSGPFPERLPALRAFWQPG